MKYRVGRHNALSHVCNNNISEAFSEETKILFLYQESELMKNLSELETSPIESCCQDFLKQNDRRPLYSLFEYKNV